ncbi:MAG: hypothetical protein ABFS32_19770 [Bacteroidota bacterium]
MKTITTIYLLFVTTLFFSCEKEDNLRPESISYEESFSTETRPIAIAIEKIHGNIFLVNHNTSISDYNSKIQKFNLKGELHETIIDFESFNSGLYDRYSPVDLCIDDNDIYVLVKPMSLSNDMWITSTGFCVLHFDLNGNLKNEFDFSEVENYWQFSAIDFSNDHIYVTSGEIVIYKIDKTSGQADYIHIPITNDKPYLLVSDMEVESEESIYITGQGPVKIDSEINSDVSICQITRLDFKADTSYTFYSNSRTGTMAAMPNNPGLTIKADRYIYLATFYGRSLEIYNKESELILQKDIRPNGIEETLPIDIALFQDNIYIVDFENNEVHIYHEE